MMSDGSSTFARVAGEYRDERDRRGRPVVPLPSQSPSPGTFNLLSLDEIEPRLDSRYLVKGWLDRGAASVVYGESNVGKTFFALDVALRVAAGRDWQGNRVADTLRPAIYVAGEGGFGIRNRIEALRMEHPELIAGANLHLLPQPVDLVQDLPRLIQTMRDLPAEPALVVIDTLARCMGSGDENSAQDMGKFVGAIDQLRAATGAHVMVVHHSGKDTAKGARGSSALRAAVDTEIELTRTGLVVTAETRKQRDMPSGSVFGYTLRDVVIGNDEDGDEVTSAIVEPAEPVAKKPKLSGQQNVAMQALDDALAHHGEKRSGDMFPDNRQCVSLERWREYCDRHSLSSGEGSAPRTAFMRVKTALQNKEQVRIVDGYVWRCRDE